MTFELSNLMKKCWLVRKTIIFNYVNLSIIIIIYISQDSAVESGNNYENIIFSYSLIKKLGQGFKYRSKD